MDGAAPDPVVTAALQEIRASRGRLRIRRLAARVSTSERHLQRRFREHVGFTPKQLAGLERFRAAVRSMHREPRRPLHGIAVRCGYYDQPHFVREIRRYSGLTPTTLRSRLAAADPT
ncbi:MAG: helix-turn-helix domain-containing protein [Gammaproteobacteria bacterium]|nr:AraC family transcriptional regulator [Gemmatimonadota bacterium]NIU80621.1 helix-turn-helix domain-containing protein [Gammaproteobacteria bacterium]NIX21409.1 helix-turn-helix domain-containing protein [Actinomycetota bacterium]